MKVSSGDPRHLCAAE